MTSTGLVWLALDGVGHPEGAPAGSVWEQDLPTLRPLVDLGLALDATLGVPGLPQSGTGQACWLTGLDAVRAMGEHYGPHPGPTLQRLLRGHALPGRLAQAGARVALANYYAPPFFEVATPPRGQDPGVQGPGVQRQATPPGRNRMGCFPFSFQTGGLPLNPPDLPLVRASLGLHYQRPWAPFMTVDEVAWSGEALGVAARGFDLLVADLWFSDLIGHEGRDPTPPEVAQAGREWLRRLDVFLGALLNTGTPVVLSSDHGNLENLTVKAHTTARVPFVGTGVALGTPTTVVEAGQTIARWFGFQPREDAEN